MKPFHNLIFYTKKYFFHTKHRLVKDRASQYVLYKDRIPNSNEKKHYSYEVLREHAGTSSGSVPRESAVSTVIWW